MDLSFCIQDPTNPTTTYLYETILDAARNAITWRGLYAFASLNGVDKLVADEALEEFFGRGGTASIVVGIDAITNRVALERLVQCQTKYPSFTPLVFWTPIKSLFHPKLSHFTYADGSQKLIVGSGNMTPGGLTGNFEAFTVTSSDPGELLDVSDLDSFFDRHTEAIRPIDDEALTRAALNIQRWVNRKGDILPDAVPETSTVSEDVVMEPSPENQRVLVAHIPKAGRRWKQAHFNADVIAQFFRVTDRKMQRVFLTSVSNDGSRGDQEARPCVYSKYNKNLKIELETPGNPDYPASGAPIGVFMEKGVRIFEYLLLFPGDRGYTEMKNLGSKLPQIGRGLPRVITDTIKLRTAWPSCPLFV